MITEREMTHFFHGARPFLAYGSLSLSFGNLAISVRVSPKGMLILEAALTAQPFAFRSGAMLRRRSLSHARIMAGPEITSMIATNTRISFHQGRALRPLKIATRAEPIIPRAIPMAANIPANLAISNGGAATGFVPSAGKAAGAALIFAVASDIIFASLSAALLLIRFSMVLAILRYGDQNDWATLIGLSRTFVITASHSTPALS